MSFLSWPWWSAGIGLDTIGVLLIILDRIGLPRVERLSERLGRLADDLTFRFWHPGEVLESLQDIYWKRRKIFFFVAGSALSFIPAFTSLLYARVLPVRVYLKGMVLVWAVIGPVFLGLAAIAAMIWVCSLRRAAYPTGIDHLLGVAFYVFSRGLLLSVPAVVLLLAVPVAANAILISLLLRLLGAFSLRLVCLPLRLSRWAHERYALRLPLASIGLLLVAAGTAVQLVTTLQ